jgi:hypothetical protein
MAEYLIPFGYMLDIISYPELSHIIMAYFNQDFDLWGKDVGELVLCYKEESDEAGWRQIVDEIEKFKHEHAENLDGDFKEIYGLYMDPEQWGHTTISFLNGLKRLLFE